eukprot:g1257.t1
MVKSTISDSFKRIYANSKSFQLDVTSLSQYDHLESEFNNSSNDDEKFRNDLTTLHKNGLHKLIEVAYLENIKNQVREKVLPQFWSYFDTFEQLRYNMSPDGGYTEECVAEVEKQVPIVLRFAFNCFRQIENTIRRISLNDVRCRQRLLEGFRLVYRAILFHDNIPAFREIFYLYFSRRLLAHDKKCCIAGQDGTRDNTNDPNESDNSDDENNSCVYFGHLEYSDEEENEENNDVQIEQKAEDEFRVVCVQLRSLGWLPVIENVAMDVVFELTEERLQRSCVCEPTEENEDSCFCVCSGVTQNFSRSGILRGILRWLRRSGIHWLTELLDEDPSARKLRTSRVEFHLYEAFGRLRISELFDIIVDFPSSEPALQDLRKCLARTQSHHLVVKELEVIFRQRLLHSGAPTANILLVYIHTVRALHILDPAGVLLNAVSAPLKKYLRSRRDTVGNIVGSLTDDKSPDSLYEELRRTATEHGLIEQVEGSDDEAVAPGENWEPERVDADTRRKSSQTDSSEDIISRIVSIYGSRGDIFVSEYRLLLAERLLKKIDFDTTGDSETLELLKMRFGESLLHNCTIMLKDIADSKRVCNNLDKKKNKMEKGKENSSSSSGVEIENVSASIISRHFWPKLQNANSQNLIYHPTCEAALQEFTETYAEHKKPRKLKWYRTLGVVDIELEFEAGHSRSFQVSPVQATFIAHFGDQESWYPAELEEKTGLSKLETLRALSFWVNQGVLSRVESANHGEPCYTVIKTSSIHGSGMAVVDEMDENKSNATLAAEDSQREENEAFVKCVIQMLASLDSLSLEDIHNRLRMFFPDYKRTEAQLHAILDACVSEGRLECNGSTYSIGND